MNQSGACAFRSASLALRTYLVFRWMCPYLLFVLLGSERNLTMSADSTTKGATRWITRAATVALALFVGLAVVAVDAEAARRFGGGKSFGRQSQNVNKQQTPPQQQQAQDAAPGNPSQQQAAPRGAQSSAAQPAPQPARNRWLGPLTGIAAGLGIAALLSHLGLMGPLAELLGSLIVVGLIALAGMFVWRMLRGSRGAAGVQRRMEPAYAGPDLARPLLVPGAGSVRPGSVLDSFAPSPAPASPQPSNVQWSVPADFDRAGFLRSAKTNFIRLQAAWDARNVEDIREFTTPEAFAELRMQMAEHAPTNARNDVAALDAELLGIEDSPSDYLASIRFFGKLRDSESGEMQDLNEVWNLSKPKNGRTGWLVAGIQQVQ